MEEIENSAKPESLPIFDRIIWKRGTRGDLGFEFTISGEFSKDLREKSLEILDWLDARRGERMIKKQIKEIKKEEVLE